MKKIFTTVIMACMLAVSAMAVTVNDVAGVFNGTLKVGSTSTSNQEIYVLPGVASNTVTLVIPSFTYNNASWGDLVLANIPMTSGGSLTINSNLYIKTRSERATIKATTATLSSSSVQLTLTITTPTIQNGISVQLSSASKVTNRNYALTNGGFEGGWSNGEPSGWHSFNSATGEYASTIKNTAQFTKATDVRPGTNGSNSALLQSKMVLSIVKANGNCTNGQINAGSMSADDAAGNYNFSDPSNNGYNTAFVGNPDSLVFWAKYIPADKNPSNSANKARANAVITTNARYQDPESSDYSKVKIATAGINYSATSDMGWQRLATPFSYTSVDPSKAAYVLITFTTNMTPGGGSSGRGKLDNIYLDDVEMIYNHALKSLKMDNQSISFSNGKATTSTMFSDSDYDFTATTNAKAAKSFIGYDEANNQVHVYVVGDNYSQTSSSYSVYTLQMAEPIRDTYYEYTATTCANESYSDELFSNLTKSGTYHTTIPNAAGHDSIITLTLNVLPTYLRPSTASIDMDESYKWRGHTYANLAPGVYTFADSLKTKAGCDSIYTLKLTVKAIGYSYTEAVTSCQNEATEWHGKTLPTAQAGTFTVYDSLQSVYGTDSVYTLTLTVLPVFTTPTTDTVKMDESYTWHEREYKDLVPGVLRDTIALQAQNGCDSLLTLELTVNPIAYAYSDSLTACQNETMEWHGKTLPTAQAGIVTVYDSLKSVYGMDSVYTLTLTVLPSWEKTETKYVNEANLEWHGQTIQGLAHSSDPYFYYDSLTAVNGCDSVYVLRLFVSDTPVTYGEYEEIICKGEQVRFNGAVYTEATDEDVHISVPNMYGGDSIVHLTIIVLPSYTIDEYLNIVVGEQQSWEWQDLSTFPVGQYELYATYYTDDDCDSTLVLHLTVEPEAIESGIPHVPFNEGQHVQKVLWNGRLYIIRDDETIYDMVGRKIQ